MVSTCSVREIKKKVEVKGFIVSIGSVVQKKPFFITQATEKELMLCLCMLCLNTRLLFKHLMAKAKLDGDVVLSSNSEFFVMHCNCA